MGSRPKGDSPPPRVVLGAVHVRFMAGEWERIREHRMSGHRHHSAGRSDAHRLSICHILIASYPMLAKLVMNHVCVVRCVETRLI